MEGYYISSFQFCSAFRFLVKTNPSYSSSDFLNAKNIEVTYWIRLNFHSSKISVNKPFAGNIRNGYKWTTNKDVPPAIAEICGICTVIIDSVTSEKTNILEQWILLKREHCLDYLLLLFRLEMVALGTNTNT